jgi:MerR family redox-sensitive transcriptional activator SoxR
METTLPIAEIARRSGVRASALRFYEERGLIRAERSTGGQRRFPRSTLRRIAFILSAQKVGLSLDEIAADLARLPDGRAPTKADWQMLSAGWGRRIDERIAELQSLRDGLTACIGCGCLSMQQCALANPGDRAGQKGPGARYWAGDPSAGRPSRT